MLQRPDAALPPRSGRGPFREMSEAPALLPRTPNSHPVGTRSIWDRGPREGVGCFALPGRLCAIRGMQGSEIDLGCANAGQVDIVRWMVPRTGVRKAEQAANGATTLPRS